MLNWFQTLDREEKLAVVASSLAILNDAGEAVSYGSVVVKDTASTESPSDSGNGPRYDIDESDLSPAGQYPSPDYRKPMSGVVDWHISLNENSSQIDEDIEQLSKEVGF